MLRLSTICVCVVLFLSANNVVANEHEGWYGAVSVGAVRLDSKDRLTNSGFLAIEDEGTVGFGLDVGYAILPFLAVEAGYQRYSDLEGVGFYCPPGLVCAAAVNDLEADMDTWTASIVANWNVHPKFSLHAKLGAVRWNIDATLDVGPGHSQHIPDVRETDLRAGLGARVALLKWLDLQFDVTSFDEEQTYALGLRWWI